MAFHLTMDHTAPVVYPPRLSHQALTSVQSHAAARWRSTVRVSWQENHATPIWKDVLSSSRQVEKSERKPGQALSLKAMQSRHIGITIWRIMTPEVLPCPVTDARACA